MIKNSLAISILLLGVGVTGCATTQSIPELTPQQCQSLDWQQVGYQDGEAGKSANYFGDYLQADFMATCTTMTAVQPNRPLWEEGRQQGLKAFCTELTAYKLGRNGAPWPAVCAVDNPNGNLGQLEASFEEGRSDYLRYRPSPYLAAPYFNPYFPYRRGYTGFRPFGWPYY